MRVFVDNDIAVKLAQWGLLKRFGLHLTKHNGAQLFMISTLKYRFKLNDPAKAAAMLGSAAAVTQLRDFVAMCAPAKGHHPVVAASLADVPSIDAGEAALFAAAAQYDAALVDTGDKKALRALGNLGASHVATQALATKVACLEQTMHYLVGRWSFAEVSKAILASPVHVDTATHQCFAGKQEPQALAALAKKVSDLVPACGGVLSTHPFGWVA